MSLWEHWHPLPILFLPTPTPVLSANNIWKMRHCSCAGEALLSGQRVSSLLPCDGPFGHLCESPAGGHFQNAHTHAHTIKFTFKQNTSRSSLSLLSNSSWKGLALDVCAAFRTTILLRSIWEILHQNYQTYVVVKSYFTKLQCNFGHYLFWLPEPLSS